MPFEYLQIFFDQRRRRSSPTAYSPLSTASEIWLWY
jgi:hypothetical protein